MTQPTAFLSAARLAAFRDRTFRRCAPWQVRTRDEAVAFVRERGFVFFWPIRGVLLPSLWVAVAGERPVPREHDDPGHITWQWKDELLGSDAWYYAKLLRGKATLVAHDVLPAFYALSEATDDPADDVRYLYQHGLLSREARALVEHILTHGATHTIALRAALGKQATGSAFDRALTEAQRRLLIMPIGIAAAGAWRYAFVYDLVLRHLPHLPEQARLISTTRARLLLLERYLESVGAAHVRDVRKVFGWTQQEASNAIEALVASGRARFPVQVEGTNAPHVALDALVMPSSIQAGRA